MMIKHFRELMILSFFSVILPILVLSGFGLYAMIKHGYSLYFIGVLLLSSLMFVIPRWLWSKNTHCINDDKIEMTLSSDWSDKEVVVAKNISLLIEDQLNKDDSWFHLKIHGFDIATEIAKEYGKKELDFTILEGLQLLEEVSRRYRKTIDKNIPLVDNVNISRIKWGYDLYNAHGDKVKTTYTWGMNAWRMVRMSSPITGIMSEIKGKLMGSVSDQVLQKLQRNAKTLLLQDIAAVCIDLYSERYMVSSDNIQHSKIKKMDAQKAAPELEPVRIVIIGQISAGKSSLVNLLLKEMKAGIDSLPFTNDVATYDLLFNDNKQLCIVDTPGLDGSKKIEASIMEQVANADLVIWVLKANQSARQLDIQLLEKINNFYSEKNDKSYKKPNIINVLSHVDQLKPVHEWHPPYDLQHDDSPKVQMINSALQYNQKLLHVDTIYPLAILNHRSFGIEVLEEAIQSYYDDAIQTQLRRRNIEAKYNRSSFIKQSTRLFNGVAGTIKVVIN